MMFKVVFGKVYKVFILLLMVWVLRRLNDDLYIYYEEWVEYKVVFIFGMKMGGDDLLYIDWLIVGGVGIFYWENWEVMDVVSEWVGKW